MFRDSESRGSEYSHVSANLFIIHFLSNGVSSSGNNIFMFHCSIVPSSYLEDLLLYSVKQILAIEVHCLLCGEYSVFGD